MKVLVCISNVPDTTTKIRFSSDNKKFESAGVQWIINPWDELALTRALELKDDTNNAVSGVTIAHVGLLTSEPTIRKALAIGADDAIRINAEPVDAYYVAAQLAEVIKNEGFDIVLCGIDSADYNGSNVGGMVSEFLGCPSVSAVSGINIEGSNVKITREIDGGKETVVVPTPFVAIVQKGIAKEPRIAAMRGIMMARTKPIKLIEPAQIDPLTEVDSFMLPQPKAACKFIEPDKVKELVDLLQNEAKIL